MDDFAADVVAFLDAIGIERATVVGHSMGSIIGRRVAELYSERIERLVLIGAAATPVNPAILAFRQAVLALQDPIAAQFAREFQVSTLHAPVPEAFLERVVAESLKLPARVWHAALKGVVDIDDSADLARISAATLLMAGELDPYFPLEEQEQLTARIPGARLRIYANTGHNPHWEHPEQVAGDLEAFLDAD
jgi:pimeloyl-ACP methyl ester carboxylesterase